MRRPLIIVAIIAILVGTGWMAHIEGFLAGPLTVLRRSLQPATEASRNAPDPAARELVARLAAENAVLRDRLEQWKQVPGEGSVAPEQRVVARGRIIGRSDRAGRRYVDLDVGRADGVSRGLAACVGWSLVGEVVAADDGRCLVQLTTDSRFRCAVAVTGATSLSAATTVPVHAPVGGKKPPGSATAAAKAGPIPVRIAEGVLAGDGRSSWMVLEVIGQGVDLPLAAGQVVTTAGSDGRFPPGLVLGRMGRPHREPGDRWVADVLALRPADDAESLLLIRP